jgi:hypothetical protein
MLQAIATNSMGQEVGRRYPLREKKILLYSPSDERIS